jgi:hypothetical protein
MRGWLTKETGQVPARCEEPACAVCTANASVEAQELRCPYMVFAVRAPGRQCAQTVFAKLEVVTVEVVLQRLVPACGSREAIDILISQLSLGLWSSAVDCGCSISVGMCSVCERVCAVPEWIRFVCADEFDGVYPKGKDHWFAGVTDALETAGEQWLRLQVGCLQTPSFSMGDMHWYTGSVEEIHFGLWSS